MERDDIMMAPYKQTRKKEQDYRNERDERE